MSKYNYVRKEASKETFDGNHLCHAEGCTRRIPPAYFMCGRHWAMVPTMLKADIWKHFRPGQEKEKNPTHEYMEAARRAIDAVSFAEKVSDDLLFRMRNGE